MMNNDPTHNYQDQPMEQPDPMETRPETRVEAHSTETQQDTGANALSTWLTHDQINDLHSRWNKIQAQFVDQPCSAVEQGDAMITEVMEMIKQALNDRHSAINSKWLDHADASTEDLRLVMQDYRTLLDRLLNI